jgi:uncharacterized membrane protein
MLATRTPRSDNPQSPALLDPASRALEPVGGRLVTAAAVVVSGLSAGFFYTYADSIRRGLAGVDDVTYVRTFQAINEHVRSPVFMAIFAGPMVLLIAAAAARRRSRGALLLLATAAAVYALGVIAITATVNIPLNETLAVQPVKTEIQAAVGRRNFEDRWNTFNLYRAVAASLSVVLAAASLIRPSSLPGSGSAERSVGWRHNVNEHRPDRRGHTRVT